MVNEVLEVMEPSRRRSRMRLVADVAPDLAIRCDHDRVIQLFSNLVGNAVKFTPDAGITVGVQPDRRHCRLPSSAPQSPTSANGVDGTTNAAPKTWYGI